MAAEVKVAMADPFEPPLLARSGHDEVASLQGLDPRVASGRADQRARGETENVEIRMIVDKVLATIVAMVMSTSDARVVRESASWSSR